MTTGRYDTSINPDEELCNKCPLLTLWGGSLSVRKHISEELGSSTVIGLLPHIPSLKALQYPYNRVHIATKQKMFSFYCLSKIMLMIPKIGPLYMCIIMTQREYGRNRPYGENILTKTPS